MHALRGIPLTGHVPKFSAPACRRRASTPLSAVLDRPATGHRPPHEGQPGGPILGPVGAQERQRPAAAPSRRTATSRQAKHAKEILPTVFVALDKSLYLSGSPGGTSNEALRPSLQALKLVGVSGVVVDVWWGLVEGLAPGQYEWAAYRQVLELARDAGLKVKVQFCFHGSRSQGLHLPRWVLAAAVYNAELLYCDRTGGRSAECLSLGVDNAPVLAGRTALEAYRGLMAAFKAEFGALLGTTVVGYTVGAGPEGELRYPSYPAADTRWSFPGVGEFQCYDQFMMSSLQACAHQVGQPVWGLTGPHDAGSYGLSPHQSAFFNQRHGNWDSAYGRFFLQWYSSCLVQHADRLLSCAAEVFGPAKGASGGAGTGLPVSLRVPAVHWWYGSASHAGELTAGYYNAGGRDGYLPLFTVMSRHGAGVILTGAEASSHEQLAGSLSQPEALLTQQRVVASALHLPVTLRNQAERFDEAAFIRMESSLCERGSSQGINLLPVQSLTFCSLGDTMLAQGNWLRFRAFLRRVRQEDGEADAGTADPLSTGIPALI